MYGTCAVTHKLFKSFAVEINHLEPNYDIKFLRYFLINLTEIFHIVINILNTLNNLDFNQANLGFKRNIESDLLITSHMLAWQSFQKINIRQFYTALIFWYIYWKRC
jgi:hypothetical protein